MAATKLFLLDAHALCYRSFYAIRELTNSRGQPTNAVYGFVTTLKKILREFEPTHLAVCFDSKGKTLREERYAQYKAQRPSMPEELASQIPIIKDVIKSFNLAIIEKKGYEADDIIGTLSEKFKKDDLEVVVVSDDKDMYQLANDRIKFFSARKDIMFDTKALKKKLGFDPAQMADFLALAGDSVDNIPGVTGIGKVTATNLINEFGSLEEILKNVKKIKSAKVQEKINSQQDQARLSKELALLEMEVPVEVKLVELEVGGPDRSKLFKIFKELEFKRLADEFAQEELSELQRATTKTSDSKSLVRLVSEIKSKSKFVFWQMEDSFYVSVNGGDVSQLTSKDLAVLKEVFEDPKVLKITFDLKNAIKVLLKNKIRLSGDCFDVMLADYLLNPVRARRLFSDLAWSYLKTSMASEEDAGQITSLLCELYPVLQEELKKKELLKLFDEIEIPLSYVLAQMEQEGVALDLKLLSELSKESDKKIKILSNKLYKIADEEFNLNSPKQLSTVLFEKLGLPVIKKTKTGFSTDEGVLTTLALQHEFPALLLEYRQLAKLKSTYIDALPKLVEGKNNKLHAQFNQSGTETGRLSSSNPNLQNIPIRTEMGRQIRKAIIPSEKSRLLLAADYSQMELRILAHLSGDETLKKAFEEDQDIHNYTASLIFDIDQKDVTTEMRYSMKRVNFGIIYGMSAFGLAKDLKIAQGEAQEFIDRYFLRYPKVKEFMDREIQKCEKNGYVLTLLNRRRYIAEIHSKNNAIRQFAQRQAINTPVQGSAADLMKLAMINVQNELQKRKLNSRMTITVHDELVFDMEKEEQDEMVTLVRDLMENPLKLDVPIKVSMKVGSNWLEMKEI